jgi:hypothetical protein
VSPNFLSLYSFGSVAKASDGSEFLQNIRDFWLHVRCDKQNSATSKLAGRINMVAAKAFPSRTRRVIMRDAEGFPSLARRVNMLAAHAFPSRTRRLRFIADYGIEPFFGGIHAPA